MTFSADNEEPSYFAYSATLRIHGADLPLEEITNTMGVLPSHQHKVGEKSRATARAYKDDAWHFTAPLPEEAELSEHLRSLWQTVRTCASLTSHGLPPVLMCFAGIVQTTAPLVFTVAPDALQIFTALNVPFGASVIVDSWLGERLSQPTEH